MTDKTTTEDAKMKGQVDWDHLNNLFAQMPAGPWDASRDTEGHEIRQIDTDPTNKHHWPFRLCRSVPGQRAACADAVFNFIAGVLNAWPQIAAERSEEAEIERILAMPKDELRKRCLVDGQSPEQTVRIADFAFECASLRAALIRISEQYVIQRGDLEDNKALKAIKSIADAALAAPRADSAERTAGEDREAWRHAVDLEQCSLFVDSPALKKSMTEAAKFLRRCTPAPSSPGAPDSVRALSEAATPGEWLLDVHVYHDEDGGPSEDHTEGVMVLDHDDQPDSIIQCSERDAAFITALVNWFRAAHPAGQSTGQGAERWRCPECGCREYARVDQRKPGGNFAPGPLVRCVECKDLFNAPDSTRTGQVDTEENWRDDPSADERWCAGVDYAQEQLCHVLGIDPSDVNWDAATETLDGDIQAVVGTILAAWGGDDWQVLAARPADPEAQGAWRPIETAPKDGREIDVWDRQDGRITVRWLSVDAACWVSRDGQQRWSAGWFTHWMPLPAPPASSGQESA